MHARCEWAPLGDPLYLAYHDEEWGVPSHDERHLFEMLTLEGAQAGLSWATILRKRAGYRRAFEGFDAERSRASARATWSGCSPTRGSCATASRSSPRWRTRGPCSRCARRARRSTGCCGGSSAASRAENRWRTLADLPAQTDESRAMSRELKRRGFRFVGPTVCYALMQAVGMVNDHVVSCFRHAEIG